MKLLHSNEVYGWKKNSDLIHKNKTEQKTILRKTFKLLVNAVFGKFLENVRNR